ncbi:hypothetical protein GIB67_021093 [Kingdonia uniflora]|uniref:Uncharacterized protein n=1 Tax=Kingdonia uniflora TaxID=39325 RepID=A0A7J7N7E3_9MAGN|nr:hypothetical protein GIB67_021093 [Kingdonia uniflora]
MSMVSTSGCAKADEVDLVGHVSPVIGVEDVGDTVAELVEWPHLKGSQVEYPTSSSRFREFCKAKSSIDGIWGHAFGYRAQFDYGLTLPLSNFAKSVMNMIGACPVQLNYNFWEVILVCETLNKRWAASGSERRITAKDFLEYYAVKYVTATDGISCKVSRNGSFIDVLAREGTVLEAILKELEISRFKKVASKDDKLTRLNVMPDGPVNMATVSSTVVRNLAKRKVTKRGVASRSVMSDSVDDNSKRWKVTFPTKSQVVLVESNKIAEGADLRPRFEVEAGLLEKQCRAKAREKMVAVVDDEFKKFARALRGVQLGFQDRLTKLEKRISQLEGEKNQFEENLTQKSEAFQLELEKEREAAALKMKEVRAESVAEAKRLVTTSATSQKNLTGKLYQLRYPKAEILAFSEGNYEEKEIMGEEEVEGGEEMEDDLNVAEKTAAANNQETIDQEIESSHLRVMDLEGLLEVEKKSSTELQIAGACSASLSVCFCRSVSQLEEFEALISQYEDRLDDNVKLSLKPEEAKSQVEDMTASILSRDLTLNQLTSELTKLKEKAVSGSRHEAELVEYRIRALNDKISEMKCKICALNEQLLKKEIDLDTARTDLAVSEADFEKINSSIAGKDSELRNSAQIRDSLIARLDRLKANFCRLKGREVQSRADLAEFQAKNKILVDDLAHAHGNVRRVVQREKEINKRINQLCARISELERELRVREMKY